MKDILETLQQAADYFVEYYTPRTSRAVSCTRENIRQYVVKGRLKPYRTTTHGKQKHYSFTKESIEKLNPRSLYGTIKT